MKRQLSTLSGLLLSAIPVATVLAGCSGGTGGLSGLGSSVTTPSSVNTKANPLPTAAAIVVPNLTVAPTPDAAKQTFELAIAPPSEDYKGGLPTGLPLAKATLKTEKEVSTLAVNYGSVAAPFELTLIKKGALAVGDVFTFGAKKGARATVKYVSVVGEEPPVAFSLKSGEKPATAKITAINGNNYGIELNDVQLVSEAATPTTLVLKGVVPVTLYDGVVVAK